MLNHGGRKITVTFKNLLIYDTSRGQQNCQSHQKFTFSWDISQTLFRCLAYQPNTEIVIIVHVHVIVRVSMFRSIAFVCVFWLVYGVNWGLVSKRNNGFSVGGYCSKMSKTCTNLMGDAYKRSTTKGTKDVLRLHRKQTCVFGFGQCHSQFPQCRLPGSHSAYSCGFSSSTVHIQQQQSEPS